MGTSDKASNIVIDYIEDQILGGNLSIGQKLPTERDLAQQLSVSRTAVREGIQLLEVMGIVERRQGSGNYITSHFDRTLEKVLTIMYALDEMTYEEVQEFRYAVERQALVLAVKNIDQDGEKRLKQYLDGMLHGKTEEEQTENDRLLHLCLVEMSGNRLVIANYMALTRVISHSVRTAREKIRARNPQDFQIFQAVHRQLAEAVANRDLDAAKKALDRHFVYVTEGYDT